MRTRKCNVISDQMENTTFPAAFPMKLENAKQLHVHISYTKYTHITQ